MDETDPRVFLQRLTVYIRKIFETEKLQDLHSEEHEAFDLASDAAIAMVGIPKDKRVGMECTTNCSTSLVFFGDCREHAIEMLAFFDYWQSLRASRLLCAGADGAQGHDLEHVEAELKEVLKVQLRAAHVGVYAPIQMDGKYEPTGYTKEEEFHPRLRVYGVDQWRAGEKQSKYELQSCMLDVVYKDGSTKTIVPYWNAPKKYWGIDNEDGVPTIPNATDVQSLTLWVLVEDHTMTFLYEEMELADGKRWAWVTCGP